MRNFNVAKGARHLCRFIAVRQDALENFYALSTMKVKRHEFRGAPASRAKQNLRAFTLIELMLVIVILAILAAIVVPKFSGSTERARVSAAQTQISNFGTALDAFEVDIGHYPKGRSGLQDLMQQPRDAQNWHGPYLKDALPLDPWNNAYVYECPGKHNPSGYDLMSNGPDGRAGTEDDIANWQLKK